MNSRPTLTKYLALVFILILCLFISAQSASVLLNLWDKTPEDLASFNLEAYQLKVILATGQIIGILLPALIFLGVYKELKIEPARWLVQIKELHGIQIIKSYAMIICTLLVASLFVVWIEAAPLPTWARTMDSESAEVLTKVLKMDSFWQYLINLALIALIPAIGEELLFRRILQKELLKDILNPHTAIILTAALFAAFHFEITGFMPKFGIGLVLGYVYYWSGNLFYPIILHFLNNGLLVTGLYINSDAAEAETISENTIMPYILASIGLPFLYLLAKSVRSSFYDRPNT